MIFPPAAIPVAIVLNGMLVVSYHKPYMVQGHVRAPVVPYLARVADAIGYKRGTLVVTRGNLVAVVRAHASEPRELGTEYVNIVPALRSLGARVTYRAREHVLIVTVAPRRTLATPTPFDARVPQPAPTMLFTPEPIVTPRPAFTGSPRPRRTPIVATPSPP